MTTTTTTRTVRPHAATLAAPPDVLEDRLVAQAGGRRRSGLLAVLVAAAAGVTVVGTSAGGQAPAQTLPGDDDVEVVLSRDAQAQPSASWTVRAVVEGDTCTGLLDWHRRGPTAAGDSVLLRCGDGSGHRLQVTADAGPDTGVWRLRLTLDGSSA